MSEPFTPDEEIARTNYVSVRARVGVPIKEAGAEFDRLIASVKATALRDYAKNRYLAFLTDPDLPATEQSGQMSRQYRLAADGLLSAADTIEREASNASTR